jgi:enoyl-CoA hydratase
MDMNQNIRTEAVGPIGYIFLNRPRQLNALSSNLMREVTMALNAYAADPAVRAIVLAGDGTAFSAGFDLKESEERNSVTPREWQAVIEADFEFIMQFWNCQKPTIAAIHGYCLAGGLELAVSCDITVADSTTLLGEPEVRFGSGIVAMIIPWLIGPKLAKQILLTGNDRITAERAAAMGLINEVTAPGKHVDRATEIAKEIAASAALSVELTKRAINRSLDLRGMRDALLAAVETDIIIEASPGPERLEFNRIRREHGLKKAVEWRDSRFTSHERSDIPSL